MITRAVGHKDYVQVDVLIEEERPGDRYLLCTDVLHGYLEGDGDLAGGRDHRGGRTSLEGFA